MRGLFKTYFDPRGRLSRGAYLRFYLRLNILAAAFLVAGIWLASHELRLIAIAAWGVVVVVYLSGFALAVRRLHDRNLSGYWFLAIFGIAACVHWFPPIAVIALPLEI